MWLSSKQHLDDWLQAEREVLAAPSEATLLSPAAEQQLGATAGATTGQVTNEFQASEPSARGSKKR